MICNEELSNEIVSTWTLALGHKSSLFFSLAGIAGQLLSVRLRSKEVSWCQV